jgi:poly-gamma-glutamate synthesis protein (capsule biosynthesis protein)
MPNAEQKKLADQLVEAGVDIIFGSHPHVIQPIEVKSILLSNGTEKKALVVYSLGNFVSNQRKRYTDSGVIVNVEVVKDYDNNTVSINRIEYIPTWVHKYYRNGKPQYKILPVEKYMNGELKGADGERIQAVWHETTGLLGDKEIDLKR